LSNFEFG